MQPLRALAHRLFGTAEPAPDDLVVLGETDGEPTAELWRNLLEQRGIRALTRNVGPHVHMATRFRVYVLRRDEDEAREILGLGGAAREAE
jgi:hypothetical protein